MKKDIKKVHLYQPGRFGDIYYLIPIARRLMELGYEVEFPIYKSRYGPLNPKDYFPDINFTILDPEHPEKLVHNYFVNVPHDTCILLPLWCGAHWKMNNGKYSSDDLMTCKYEMYNEVFGDNLDPNTYWHNLTWKRFPEREKKLMDELGIQPEEKYVLVSEGFAWGKVQINVEGDMKVIQLGPKEGYSILDWSGVIENAYEIHCTDSSTLYLVDRLKTTDRLHRYRRSSEDVRLSHLFSKKYIIHNVDGSILEGLW